MVLRPRRRTALAHRRPVRGNDVMRRGFALALVACRLFSSDGARADGGRLSMALSLGYAAPIGSTERGDHLPDAGFGLVPFAVDGAYRLLPRLGVPVPAQY